MNTNDNNNIFNKYVSIVYLSTFVCIHHIRIDTPHPISSIHTRQMETVYEFDHVFREKQHNISYIHKIHLPNCLEHNQCQFGIYGPTDTTSFLVDWIIKLHQGAYSTLKLTQFVNTITFNKAFSSMRAIEFSIWTIAFSRGRWTTNYNSNNGQTLFELCNIETKSPINMIEL